MINLNKCLINMTYVISTSQADIASIISLSINNTFSIDIFNSAKLNEPSWALLPIPPTLTQTMHLWKFRKNKLGRNIYPQSDD